MLNVKKTLTKLMNRTDKEFYTAVVYANDYGFTANQSRSGLTKSYTQKTGYTPILVEAHCNTHKEIILQDATLSGGTVTFWGVNTSSSTQSSVGFRFVILYLKTELGGGSI